MSTISRRAFLKTVGVGALSVAAMSVLAGCDTTSIPSDPTTPTTTSLSADVQAEVARILGASIPGYITFADSAALDADLAFTVGGAGVLDVLPNYMLSDSLTAINGATGTVAADLYNTLAGEVDVTALSTTSGSVALTLNTIGATNTLKDAEENLAQDGNSRIPDARAVGLWSISSEIAYANLVRQIALAFIAVAGLGTDDFGNLLNAVGATATNEGYNFRFSYAVSVSSVTKQVNSSSVGVDTGANNTVPGVTIPNGGAGQTIQGGSIGAADPSATFIAVQIVRTASAQ